MQTKTDALELRDRLGKYRAIAEHCRLEADTAALACQCAERRYARANERVRELEKELRDAR